MHQANNQVTILPGEWNTNVRCDSLYDYCYIMEMKNMIELRQCKTYFDQCVFQIRTVNNQIFSVDNQDHLHYHSQNFTSLFNLLRNQQDILYYYFLTHEGDIILHFDLPKFKRIFGQRGPQFFQQSQLPQEYFKMINSEKLYPSTAELQNDFEFPKDEIRKDCQLEMNDDQMTAMQQVRICEQMNNVNVIIDDIFFNQEDPYEEEDEEEEGLQQQPLEIISTKIDFRVLYSSAKTGKKIVTARLIYETLKLSSSNDTYVNGTLIRCPECKINEWQDAVKKVFKGHENEIYLQTADTFEQYDLIKGDRHFIFVATDEQIKQMDLDAFKWYRMVLDDYSQNAEGLFDMVETKNRLLVTRSQSLYGTQTFINHYGNLKYTGSIKNIIGKATTTCGDQYNDDLQIIPLDVYKNIIDAEQPWSIKNKDTIVSVRPGYHLKKAYQEFKEKHQIVNNDLDKTVDQLNNGLVTVCHRCNNFVRHEMFITQCQHVLCRYCQYKEHQCDLDEQCVERIHIYRNVRCQSEHVTDYAKQVYLTCRQAYNQNLVIVINQNSDDLIKSLEFLGIKCTKDLTRHQEIRVCELQNFQALMLSDIKDAYRLILIDVPSFQNNTIINRMQGIKRVYSMQTLSNSLLENRNMSCRSCFVEQGQVCMCDELFNFMFHTNKLFFFGPYGDLFRYDNFRHHPDFYPDDGFEPDYFDPNDIEDVVNNILNNNNGNQHHHNHHQIVYDYLDIYDENELQYHLNPQTVENTNESNHGDSDGDFDDLLSLSSSSSSEDEQEENQQNDDSSDDDNSDDDDPQDDPYNGSQEDSHDNHDNDDDYSEGNDPQEDSQEDSHDNHGDQSEGNNASENGEVSENGEGPYGGEQEPQGISHYNGTQEELIPSQGYSSDEGVALLNEEGSSWGVRPQDIALEKEDASQNGEGPKWVISQGP